MKIKITFSEADIERILTKEALKRLGYNEDCDLSDKMDIRLDAGYGYVRSAEITLDFTPTKEQSDEPA